MDDLFSTPPQNNSQGINLDKPNDNIGSTNNSNGFGYGSTAYNSKPSSDYNNGNFGYGSTAYNAQQNNANSNSQFGYGETRTSNAYDNTGYSNNNAYGNSGYGNSGYNNNSYGNSGYGNSGYGTNNMYGDGYDSSASFSSSFSSSFTRNAELFDIVKGAVGAIVGALPGFLLWILLGRLGVVATIAGCLLAIGTVAGFKFMTKDVSVPNNATLLICILVPVVAIYLANKIIFCSTYTNLFLGDFDKIMGLKYTSEFTSLSKTIKDAGLTNSEFKELWQNIWKEEFNMSKITFGSVFSNLSRILDKADGKGEYIGQLLKSYLFAGLGAFAVFKKTGV